jgi:hypothetical protein
MKKIIIKYLKWLVPVVALSLSACSGNQPGISEQDQDQYMKLGAEITAASGTTLAYQLKTALADGGIENAVKYCNLMANPLVDSISTRYSAKIRRTTLHARNPKNIPAMNEKKVLLDYQKAYESKQELSARLEKLEDGSIVYYSPILVNSPLCLNCHGEAGKSMNEDNYMLIKSLYPEDDAIDYKEGDFRGMWSVTFEKGN